MKRTYNPATGRHYYLNSHGTRGVRIDAQGNRETLPVSMDQGQTIRPRAVTYWQQCGNFAFPCVRMQGRIITLYPNTEATEPEYWTTYANKYPTPTPPEL
jgi:hypothetical protein